MFDLFNLFIKRISEQTAEYAAAQSDVARRAWGEWADPFQTTLPARVVDRPSRGRASRRAPIVQRRSS
ncbi:hypothetical protein D3C87_1653020 [compost metagenome]